jgi:hypothetical protein
MQSREKLGILKAVSRWTNLVVSEPEPQFQPPPPTCFTKGKQATQEYVFGHGD